MEPNEGQLSYVFRSLGEATAIVLFSCSTYMAVLLLDSASPPDNLGSLPCGGMVLALIWFFARIVLMNKRRFAKVKHSRHLHQYELMDRAHLRRVAAPSIKKKKRKNSMDGDESIYRIYGRGTQATDPVDLDTGLYRLGYQFSQETPVTVSLVQRLSGEKDVLLTSVCGIGSKTFMVEQADRYLFQVDIAWNKTSGWKIEIERV